MNQPAFKLVQNELGEYGILDTRANKLMTMYSTTPGGSIIDTKWSANRSEVVSKLEYLITSEETKRKRNTWKEIPV